MQKILIFYPYFSPAFKAGGPIQSINSMVANLHQHYELYIFCTNEDLDGTTLPNIATSSWTNFKNQQAKVWYAPKKMLGYAQLKNCIDTLKPDVIFINGLFDLKFTIYPLLISTKAKKIISARGMLQPEALAKKSIKKKCFLAIFKLCNWHTLYSFHATNSFEKTAIESIMGSNCKVNVANNFPLTATAVSIPEKSVGLLLVCTTAIISPMKNILPVLQALALVKSNIVYNIYGPIMDTVYWQKCNIAIANLPKNILVNYRGVVNAEAVASIVSTHHLYIQPSESENFGHALYQALQIGRPIITSHATPWNNLAENNAGVNVNPHDVHDIANVIEHFSAASNEAMRQYSLAANIYASKAIDKNEIVRQYNKMFATKA